MIRDWYADENRDWRTSMFCENERRFWCCCKSNDFDFSANLRIKSSIVKWNFVIDFRNIDEDVANEINNEHVVDAIDAEMTSEINEFLVCSENVTDLNIEIFDVVFDEMFDEVVCEIVDKIVEILSLFLLKFRLETLIIFVAWCWRMCSWNLLFDSKIFSHCLQTTFRQTIWICCSKRVNDEKNAKHCAHEWYCDEKCETNEFDTKISNFEEKNFAKDFAKNATIKIFSHSFKLFLTISLCSFSLYCLYQIIAKSRKHSSNKISKSDSRYWCWHCRNCCTKLEISQNKLNSWISHRRVASKKSISATTKVSLTISTMIFEIFFSSCKTRKH